MAWGELTLVAIAVGAVSLFLRWRWPAVPTTVAMGGLGGSVCVALLSTLQLPPLLLGSFALNAAFSFAALDLLFKSKAKGTEENTADNKISEDQKTTRRRKLLRDGRQMISRFHLQNDYDSFVKFLNTQAAWEEIRPHLDAESRRNLESTNIFVVTKNDVKDGKVYYLRTELDRLEGEWGLR